MIINIPPHGKCIECAHWKSGKERNRPFAGCEIYGHEDPGYSGELCDEFEASPAKPSGSKNDTVKLMSSEEAIEVLKNNSEYDRYYIGEVKSKSQEAIDMAISALSENKGEWIPVSERLPEIHQYVLLSLRSLDVEVGFRAETEPYFYCHGADGCYIEPQNVLAWQPLPEPYKAESEEK